MNSIAVAKIGRIVEDAFERGDITEDDESFIDMIKLLNQPRKKLKNIKKKLSTNITKW